MRCSTTHYSVLSIQQQQQHLGPWNFRSRAAYSTPLILRAPAQSSRSPYYNFLYIARNKTAHFGYLVALIYVREEQYEGLLKEAEFCEPGKKGLTCITQAVVFPFQYESGVEDRLQLLLPISRPIFCYNTILVSKPDYPSIVRTKKRTLLNQVSTFCYPMTV